MTGEGIDRVVAMQTITRKTAADILRGLHTVRETYQSVETARARRARDLLGRILQDGAFQEELCAEYSSRKRGFARTSHPDWAVKLAHVLVNPGGTYKASLCEMVWVCSKDLHDEAGGDGQRPLATLLLEQERTPILSELAFELMRDQESPALEKER